MPKVTSPTALELRSEAIGVIRMAIADLRSVEAALRRDYRDRAMDRADDAMVDIALVKHLVCKYKNQGRTAP